MENELNLVLQVLLPLFLFIWFQIWIAALAPDLEKSLRTRQACTIINIIRKKVSGLGLLMMVNQHVFIYNLLTKPQFLHEIYTFKRVGSISLSLLWTSQSWAKFLENFTKNAKCLAITIISWYYCRDASKKTVPLLAHILHHLANNKNAVLIGVTLLEYIWPYLYVSLYIFAICVHIFTQLWHGPLVSKIGRSQSKFKIPNSKHFI